MKRNGKELAEIKEFLENDKMVHVTFNKNFVVYNEKEDRFEIKFDYKFDTESCLSYQEAKDIWILDKKQKQKVIKNTNKKYNGRCKK